MTIQFPAVSRFLVSSLAGLSRCHERVCTLPPGIVTSMSSAWAMTRMSLKRIAASISYLKRGVGPSPARSVSDFEATRVLAIAGRLTLLLSPAERLHGALCHVGRVCKELDEVLPLGMKAPCEKTHKGCRQPNDCYKSYRAYRLAQNSPGATAHGTDFVLSSTDCDSALNNHSSVCTPVASCTPHTRAGGAQPGGTACRGER